MTVNWPLLGVLAAGVTVIVALTTVLTAFAITRTPPIRLITACE